MICIGITPDYSYEKNTFCIHEAYVNAIQNAGGIAVILTPDTKIPWFVDGILLTGGGDIDPLYFEEEPIIQNGEISPLRDAYELQLCKEALQKQIPLLGVCRGMQIINIAAGGSIYQDIFVQTHTTIKHKQQAPRYYPTHHIHILSGTKLHELFQQQKIAVNSVHHQAVSTIAEGFLVSARSADGLAEAIEKEGEAFVIGVQWHPEAMKQNALFEAFVHAAVQYQNKKYKEGKNS